jgi:hypothetical protein
MDFENRSLGISVQFNAARGSDPRLVRGGAIPAATDIHLLSVVLYELLAGGWPFTLTGRSPSAIEAAIRTEYRAAAQMGREEPNFPKISRVT